jgi:hypothetical protein
LKGELVKLNWSASRLSPFGETRCQISFKQLDGWKFFDIFGIIQIFLFDLLLKRVNWSKNDSTKNYPQNCPSFLVTSQNFSVVVPKQLNLLIIFDQLLFAHFKWTTDQITTGQNGNCLFWQKSQCQKAISTDFDHFIIIIWCSNLSRVRTSNFQGMKELTDAEVCSWWVILGSLGKKKYFLWTSDADFFLVVMICSVVHLDCQNDYCSKLLIRIIFTSHYSGSRGLTSWPPLKVIKEIRSLKKLSTVKLFIDKNSGRLGVLQVS